MNRESKINIAKDLTDKVARAKAAFLVDFKGIKVDEVTDLRKNLRRQKAELQVVRNTLAKRALVEHPEVEKHWASSLKGPNAFVFAYDEVSEPAKALAKVSGDLDCFKIKSAVLDGRLLDAKAVRQLATLPGKDELRAQLLSVLQAPAGRLVRTLNEVASSFVRVLSARVEGKSNKE